MEKNPAQKSLKMKSFLAALSVSANSQPGGRQGVITWEFALIWEFRIPTTSLPSTGHFKITLAVWYSLSCFQLSIFRLIIFLRSRIFYGDSKNILQSKNRLFLRKL
jgi:hypothetical protein